MHTGSSKSGGVLFATQYSRLMIRRGKNRAKMAVANSLFIAIHYIVRDHILFKDRGEGYYNKFNTENKINIYIKKPEKLGVNVHIEAAPALA